MGQAKVITRLVGGLGNQLFCYAAARRLAEKVNAELVLDHVSGFESDHAYKRAYQLDHFHINCRKATRWERLEPFPRTRRFLKRRWNRLLPFQRRNYVQQDGVDFDPRILEIRPKGTLHLEGYWQSEGYFKDVEGIVRTDLRIIPPTDDRNQALGRIIRQDPSVAVHVRMGEMPAGVGGTDALKAYYTQAVARMETLAPGAHYWIFSDRPEEAMEQVPFPEGRAAVVGHNRGDAGAIADFWLMRQCHHFIIGMSTFSWWAAWLGDVPGKIVVAPGHEIRQGKIWWGFDGLLPPEWIRI